MRYIKGLIYIIVFGLFTLASIAKTQMEQNKKADSKTIKLMTYNLKFASPTFKPS
jgi:hypothetical protein